MKGYFTLGGGIATRELKGFTPTLQGNLISSKGHWVLDTDVAIDNIRIPARDKKVVMAFSGTEADQFRAGLETLDSSFGSAPYSTKLGLLPLHYPSMAVVVNESVSTHSGIGIRVHQKRLYMVGLTDTTIKCSYIVWSDTPDPIETLLAQDPLRYLLYRFPTVETHSVFLQGEALCSRWWRWTKNNSQLLQAFNALEQKLYGHKEA